MSHYLQLLGTGGADCINIGNSRNRNCKEAVKLGGRNIRHPSSLFIYPDCIIDFSAETCKQIERFNIDQRHIRYLFITHTHFDHFHPHSIIEIAKAKKKEEYLYIYGNSWAVKLLKMEEQKERTHRIKTQLLRPLKEYRVGYYSVIPVEANHTTDPNEGIPAEMRYAIDEVEKSKNGVWIALNYIIRIKNKVILYASDTGWPSEETYQVYKKFKFDIVIYEATLQKIETEMHMNFSKVVRLKKRMIKDGIISKKTCFVLTHISCDAPVYDKIKDIFLKDRIIVGFDGMMIHDRYGSNLTYS